MHDVAQRHRLRLINPEVTPAQKHYAEAERMLAFIEHDRNLTTTQHSEVAARAQVHATLAQAASLREVLESRATTRYHVTVQDEASSADAAAVSDLSVVRCELCETASQQRFVV